MIHRFAVVVVLLSASAIGQTSHWAAPGDKTAQWMIDQERRWAEGPCDHNRVAASILADDFQGTGMDGKRYTKADDLADSDDKSHSAADCKLLEAKVRFFGDNLAIVYGSESRVLKDKEGKDFTRTQVWTDTWLKRDGKWQIVAAQDGRVEPREAPKASTGPPLQFLLAAAARDFRDHSPHSLSFRAVRFGRVVGADGAEQYLLCGEFLSAQQQGKAEWTPFATIKTSGYEQWQGAQAAGFCRRPTIVWQNEGDLSSALQGRFDASQ